MYNVLCRTIVNLFILSYNFSYAYGAHQNDYCAQLQIPETTSKCAIVEKE